MIRSRTEKIANSVKEINERPVPTSDGMNSTNFSLREDRRPTETWRIILTTISAVMVPVIAIFWYQNNNFRDEIHFLNNDNTKLGIRNEQCLQNSSELHQRYLDVDAELHRTMNSLKESESNVTSLTIQTHQYQSELQAAKQEIIMSEKNTEKLHQELKELRNKVYEKETASIEMKHQLTSTIAEMKQQCSEEKSEQQKEFALVFEEKRKEYEESIFSANKLMLQKSHEWRDKEDFLLDCLTRDEGSNNPLFRIFGRIVDIFVGNSKAEDCAKLYRNQHQNRLN